MHVAGGIAGHFAAFVGGWRVLTGKGLKQEIRPSTLEWSKAAMTRRQRLLMFAAGAVAFGLGFVTSLRAL